MKKLTLMLLTNFLFCSTCMTATRTILVKNGITKKMTQYKYFLVKYSPSSFEITVNEQKIENGEEKKISISENKLSVRYDYEFGHHRKGAKVVEFKIPEKTKNVTIKFAWKKEWRVIIDGAEPLSVTPIKV